MIRRLLAFLLVVWALGFALFSVALPGPAPETNTDGIVVLTGGAGRIQRGLTLLRRGRAQRMLVSGVDRRVLPHELAIEYGVSPAFVAARVDLGNESVDTRSNARETAIWARRRGYRSLRLVTTDWHMPRARFEMRRALAGDVALLPDAVTSEPGFAALLTEYNKYLLRRATAPFDR